MNKLIIAVMGLGLMAAMQAAAQQTDNRQPPRSENRPGTMEALTDAQVAQVKGILAKYDANTLTADQAKAIHEAFRQAGLRGGPAMGDAIKAAGFDPDKLRDLAPPPGQGERQTGSKQQDEAQADGSRRSETKTDGVRKDGAKTGSSRRSEAKTASRAGDRTQGGTNRPEPRGQEARGQGQYSIKLPVLFFGFFFPNPVK